MDALDTTVRSSAVPISGGRTTTSPPRGEIIGIQYLRALAALMVVIFHISLQIKFATNRAELDTLQTGVDIFFVISGFVMVLSTNAGRRYGAVEFMKKRLVRIAPLYWAATVTMIVVLVVEPRFIRASKVTWPYAIASLAFLAHSNPASPRLYIPLVTPGWTLNTEILFYFVFALALATGLKGWGLILGASTPIVCLSLIGLTLHPIGFAGFYTRPIMIEFIFGMIVAGVFMEGQIRLRSHSARVLLLLALVTLIVPIGPEASSSMRWIRFGVPAAIVVGSSLLAGLPRWKPLRILGDASYSLYLSHFFVLSALSQLWKKLHLATYVGALWLYPFGVMSSLIVGFVCWQFVEIPLTNLGRRLLQSKAHPKMSPASI